MSQAIIIILSVVLIIDVGAGLWCLMKIDQLKSLLKDISYNLRRVEGALPHDNLRINYCLNEIKKVVTE